jgi:exodeoxyribonuclease V alpha subunit
MPFDNTGSMKPIQAPSTQETLAGLVERVTFHNVESGFCVLRVKARGHRELATVIGHAAAISAGEWVTASGEWINDRTHGQQFKARFLRTSAPTSVDGIEKYLASGMIRGIGPVYAKKLVRAFGESVFDVIEAEPDRLREVPGIGPVRAERITAAWVEQKMVREIMVFLHSHGVGTARAVRIYKTYGADAVQVMSENPYRLARDIRGIGFKTADAIAMKLGIEKGAMIRVRAGISFALTEAMDEGHCGLPVENLLPLAEELLEVPTELVQTALDLELSEGTVVADSIGETPCQPALAVDRSRQGPAVGGTARRPDTCREPGGGDPPRAEVEGDGDHRWPWRRQDDHRQWHPAYPFCQGRSASALCADRPRRQTHERGNRLRGQDDPPAA